MKAIFLTKTERIIFVPSIPTNTGLKLPTYNIRLNSPYTRFDLCFYFIIKTFLFALLWENPDIGKTFMH